jgi:adenine-specific DNA-methyltransferase
MNKSIDNLKYFLKEMFQFNENDLDFGIYKIYNLKRKHIEGFIDGDSANDLAQTIETTLEEVNLENQKTDAIELYNFFKNINKESLLDEPEKNYKKIKGQLELDLDDESQKSKLIDTLNSLTKSEGITDELKDKIYNHILGFFQMYYSNGDFGYNDRSRDLYKVPYEADYNGSDTMFHWKHKGSLYIKTGTSFNAIKFDLNGNKIEYRLETNENSEEEGTSQNNNKDSQLKHYRFDRIEKIKDKATKETIYQVVFNLSDASTSKVEIFKAIYKEVFKETDIDKYLEYTKDDKTKQVFVDLTKDFDKVQNGGIKGLSALRQKKLKIEKAVKNNFDRGVLLYDEETKQFTNETLQALYTLDRKLNSFYIGNDADYFIHENLNEFLTNEKNRYVKNYIFDDLESIYANKLDNTTLLIAKAFDKVGTRIIEFLSAIEDFQKHLFTKKKKVVESEYCITVDYIEENYYQNILDNEKQLQEWQNLFSLEVKTIEDIKANPTLVLDTKYFKQSDGTNHFKDKILSEIDDLDNKTNGLLINSENYQGLNLIKNKYQNKIDCIHIDPPYNTDTSGFLYKNEFKHSSWITMMQNKVNLCLKLMKKDSLFMTHIDENEYESLFKVFNESKLINSGTIIWDKRNPMNGGAGIANQHEYILCYSPDNPRVFRSNKLIYEILDKSETLIANEGEVNDNVRKKFSKWINSNDLLSGGAKAYKYIDDKGNVYQSVSLRAPEPRKDKKFHIPLIHPLTGKPCPTPPNGFSRTPETLKTMMDNDGILFGEDESNQPRQKSILSRETQFQLPSVIQDAKKGKTYTDKLGVNFPYCHPVSLYKELVGLNTIGDNAIVLDFFAGSGTTGQAILELNREEDKNRKYFLMEMGTYINAVTKPRIQKVIYSDNWKNGKPSDNNGSLKHIFKYQVLEQYEDVLDNLQVYKGALPDNLPIKYLYKPEENSLDTTLNLFTPFSNTISYGQPTQQGFIDITETYNYLQGYFVKSIKTYALNKKYYKVIETTNGVLVIWRDIAINEDDNTQIIEIASKYGNIHTIEVNAEFATLNLNKSNYLNVEDTDIELIIISKEVFNQ